MDEEKEYTWETEYERTWEALKEDDDGSLQAAVDDVIHRAKRRRALLRDPNVRLGMMRHLFIVVDLSTSMEDQDLRPNRLFASLKLLEKFVEEFFDQNPISQLGILTTSNKRADKLTELGGNPKRHIQALRGLKERACIGEPSLQNALDLAAQTLKHMPGHSSREVLIVFGSLTTCDPGSIIDTIQSMKANNVQVSIIGLAADVRICRKICHDTQGQYHVIVDEPHFKELLNQQVTPPNATSSTESSLIRMGFPRHEQGQQPSMCNCHLESSSSEGFSTGGYFCPQCRSKYCELPVECRACGLTLVSAPHLARSYHHLFLLEPFNEVRTEVAIFHKEKRICYSCQSQLNDPMSYQCSKCRQVFCVDCDLFVHETLHSCPGCSSSRKPRYSE
ncbi:hypothetical protein CAPTEDRAFT_178402 [Capitella teleta]|uniref:General transcription factor IIH subunit n=1 Tax=Capitella teleta TaxID=283909 RepID=R7VKJ3_CAPTE|nr:hypothetical protein CAPTEDRAFT_178402 [Capitella teleta]|eukprot:ELU17421.1 hypothetical protein CAPTEDRAFT_178402 [Capitella teleta]